MSSATFQHTVAGPAVCRGVGVHSGLPVRLVVRPAPVDAGVVFVRLDVTDRDNRVRVSPAAVVDTRLHTVLGDPEGVTVSTVEHVLAALAGLGVDNAVVELDGPESPIMDGSALPFVRALDRAGLRAQAAPRRHIEILEPIVVEHGDKRAALLPGEGFALDVEIAFASAAVGRQRWAGVLDEAAFRRYLAPARTFGFVEEVEALRAMGLARGAGLHNAVAIDGDRVLNPEGLRFHDECVRHKALDAVGDLYVLGAPILGRYEARYPGHALNNALARALVERPRAWRERRFQPDFAAAG